MIAGRRLQSVVVVGDGIVGLMASITLRRALPNAQIRLVMLPDNGISWLNRLGACGPNIQRFHRQIGLSASVFAKRTRADMVHLRHYHRAGGTSVREACTPTVNFVEGVPLHHIWMRHCKDTGATTPDFAAMLLALQEARGEEGGFGVRFDAAAYQALLTEMARALQVEVIAADDISVTVDSDAVQAITTEGGLSLSADFYIDSAGPWSRLLAARGVAREDWSTLVPPYAVTVESAATGPTGEERLTHDGNATVWRTSAWTARLQPDANSPAPGRMARPWNGNVVALGEAAMHVPLSDGMGLSHAIEDILRLIALLPRPNAAGDERAEYNRRTRIAQDAMADWRSLNFATDASSRPDTLTALLDAFAARGRVATTELDPIPTGAWLSRLMVLRPMPRRVDPTALALPDSIIQSTIARAVPAAP